MGIYLCMITFDHIRNKVNLLVY